MAISKSPGAASSGKGLVYCWCCTLVSCDTMHSAAASASLCSVVMECLPDMPGYSSADSSMSMLLSALWCCSCVQVHACSLLLCVPLQAPYDMQRFTSPDVCGASMSQLL